MKLIPLCLALEVALTGTTAAADPAQTHVCGVIGSCG